MSAPLSHDLSALESDPRLFLYTSLTAGSSHIITATSRMETILRANRIPFTAIDTATDEKAKRLWQRRAREKKLPGLVKEGFVIGDLTDLEDWNEFGEVHENIGDVPEHGTPAPKGGQSGVLTAAAELKGTPSKTPAAGPTDKTGKADGVKVETKDAKADTKKEKVDEKVDEKVLPDRTKELKPHHPSIDHLSAPASRIQSGTATPAGEKVEVDDKEDEEEKAEEAGTQKEGKSRATAEKEEKKEEEVKQDDKKDGDEEEEDDEDEDEDDEEDDDDDNDEDDTGEEESKVADEAKRKVDTKKNK